MEHAFTAEERLLQLGRDLRDLRLARNLGQVEVAARAGVARTAIQNLESGRGTLSTLVRVVRALDRQDWLTSLGAQTTVNPLHLVRHAQKRQRSSGGRRGKPKTPR